MKRKLIVALIAGVLLYNIGCIGKPVVTNTPLGSRMLIIRSNHRVVVEENIFIPPRITTDKLNYFVEWVDSKGQLGIFIGPRESTNVVIKGGNVENRVPRSQYEEGE